MAVDKLSDMFNIIKTHEMKGKKECKVPYSKLIGNVLEVMKKHGYIKDYKYIDDGKGGYFEVKLAGKINMCKSIKPRLPVKKNEWIEIESNYLPGVGIGIIIVSTPKGVLTNEEAKKLGIGGRLLGFVY